MRKFMKVPGKIWERFECGGLSGDSMNLALRLLAWPEFLPIGCARLDYARLGRAFGMGEEDFHKAIRQSGGLMEIDESGGYVWLDDAWLDNMPSNANMALSSGRRLAGMVWSPLNAARIRRHVNMLKHSPGRLWESFQAGALEALRGEWDWEMLRRAGLVQGEEWCSSAGKPGKGGKVSRRKDSAGKGGARDVKREEKGESLRGNEGGAVQEDGEDGDRNPSEDGDRNPARGLDHALQSRADGVFAACAEGGDRDPLEGGDRNPAEDVAQALEKAFEGFQAAIEARLSGIEARLSGIEARLSALEAGARQYAEPDIHVPGLINKNNIKNKKEDLNTCAPRSGVLAAAVNGGDCLPAIPVGEDRSCGAIAVCRPAEPAIHEAPFIVFDCIGGASCPAASFEVPRADVDKWSDLYRACDVPAELRKMKGWLEANPQKRKTKRGMPRFIANWLCRAQDRGGAGQGMGGLRESEWSRRKRESGERARRFVEEKLRNFMGSCGHDQGRDFALAL